MHHDALRIPLSSQLRDSIRDQLFRVEELSTVRIRFDAIEEDEFYATFGFDPSTQTPVIGLGKLAEDVDLAHELVHMEMWLIESCPIACWRCGVERPHEIDCAFARIFSIVEDEEVHRRLADSGLKLDGEVIRSPYWTNICPVITNALNNGQSRLFDGMAGMDVIGYGHLQRVTYLVQAELINSKYSSALSAHHALLLRDFIRAFRKWRQPESLVADQILELFCRHNVHSTVGRAAILKEWFAFEGIGGFVGVSHYEKRRGRFQIPCPP